MYMVSVEFVDPEPVLLPSSSMFVFFPYTFRHFTSANFVLFQLFDFYHILLIQDITAMSFGPDIVYGLCNIQLFVIIWTPLK